MKITKLKVAIVASLLVPAGVVATQFNTQEETKPVVKQEVVQEEEPKVQEQPDTEQVSEIVNTQLPKITEPQVEPPAEVCDPDSFQDVIEAKVTLDKKKSEAEAHKQDYIANRPGQLNNEQLDAMIEMKFGVLINSLTEKYETLKSTRC